MGKLIELMQQEATVRFLISYLPTFLFILIILVGIIKGFVRGLKKTSVYIIHSIVCATICLILFFVLVNVRAVDSGLLSLTNNILGSPNMQELMDVSQDCKSFREIFIEYIPKQMTFFDGLSLILEDNGAYLSTLVDVAYRLTFGFALFILYLIMRFFAYVFYHVFFLQRRYIRKQTYLYGNGVVDTPPAPRRKLGGLLGGSASLVKGIIMLSFVGTFFFIFAGGIGNKKSEDVKLKQNEYNLIYGAYSEIGSYGTKGIYKILNSVRDEKNVPYYLFVTNMLYKGNLDDSVQNIKGNVYLTDEVAAYTSFSRDTLNLFIKYDRENIVKFVNQEDNIDMLNEIIKVFQNKDFQKEFGELIDKFEAKTYFINLTLALTNSIASHLEELEFSKDLANNELAPLRIMFEEGYLCSDIPSEKELIDAGEEETLPYIQASHLLKKEDINVIYKIFINFIDNFYDNTMKPEGIMNMIKASLDNLQELSIFDSYRKDELDPVFNRVYRFYENKYLGGSSDILNNTITLEKLDVSWIEELSALIDYCDYGLDIYNASKSENGSVELITIINEMFKEERKEELKILVNGLASSKLLGYVLSANTIFEGFGQGLDSISPGATLSKDVSFANVYDSSGNFIEYGELYYLLKSISLLSDNPESRDAFLNILTGNETSSTDESQAINTTERNNLLADDPVVTEEEAKSYDGTAGTLKELLDTFGKNEKIVNTLAGSKIFSSIISNYLIQSITEESDFNLYIADSIRITEDGKLTNIIQNEEIKKIFANATFLIEIYSKIDEAENSSSETNIYDYFMELVFSKNSNLENALESKIIEGTISNYLFNKTNSDNSQLQIPAKYKLENATTDEEKEAIKSTYISSKYKPSEIKKLINVVNKVNDPDNGKDFKKFIDGGDQEKINFIRRLQNEEIDSIFTSEILYYSISSGIINLNTSTIKIVVPNIVKVRDAEIDLISKKELKEFVIDFKYIDIKGNTDSSESSEAQELPQTDTDKLFISIEKNKFILNNIIMNATISKYLRDELTNDQSDLKTLVNINLNDRYKNALSDERVDGFTSSNIWYSETIALFESLDTLFNISKNPNFTFQNNDLTEKIKQDIFKYNYKITGQDYTKLDLIVRSYLVSLKITEEIDKQFDNNQGSIYFDGTTRNLAKSNGIYKKAEIEALINIINYYWDEAISDTNFWQSNPSYIDKQITSETTKSIDNNMIFVYIEYHIKNKIDTYLEKVILKDNTNKIIYENTLLHLVFKSSITRKSFTDKFKEFNFVSASNIDLIVDKDGLIQETDAESLIELLSLFDISSSDFDAGDAENRIIDTLTGKISDSDERPKYLLLLDERNSNETELKYFYRRSYILSLFLYKVVGNIFPGNNNLVIPTEAKVYANDKYYDAIKQEEAEGLLKAAEIFGFGGDAEEINFSGIIPSSSITENEANDRINTVSSSRIFSSYFTSIIKNKVEIPTKVTEKDRKTGSSYISTGEIKELLVFIKKYQISDEEELNAILDDGNLSIVYKQNGIVEKGNDGKVISRSFSAYDVVESAIISYRFFNQFVNLININGNDLPTKYPDKQQEIQNMLAAAVAIGYINENGDLAENYNWIEAKPILINNYDIVYESIVISSIISSEIINNLDADNDDRSFCKSSSLVYDLLYKRLKKDELYTLLTIDLSNQNDLLDNLDSGIVRYFVTKQIVSEYGKPMLDALEKEKIIKYEAGYRYKVLTEESIQELINMN